MALDTNGNPAVDFAWGNFPLQPNADRATSAASVVSLLAYADEKDGKQRFYSNELPADFVAGAEFEVSGFSQAGLNRKYVVESVEALTPGGYIKTTTPYIAYEGMSSPPSNNLKATIDPNKNFGGGAGDKGWSKTTKARSVHLDPALDGHAILDLGWNGYPGYTPGVNVPPFDPISFIASNGGQYWLNAARWQMASGSYDGNAYTFRVDFAPQVFGAEWNNILNLLGNDALPGKTLTFTGINTGYGEIIGAGQPFTIIAAWTQYDSMYDSYSLMLKTKPEVVNGTDLRPMESTQGWLQTNSSFVIAAPEASVGSAFEIAKISDTYGDNVNLSIDWMNYENAWMIPLSLLSAEQEATLRDTATVGKFMATSNLQYNPEHMWWTELITWCDVIDSVQDYTDGYGVQYLKVFFNAAGESGSTAFINLTVAGERLVILK